MEVWHGSKDPAPDKFTVTKPWRRPRHRVVAPAKKKKMMILKETESDGISLGNYGRHLTSQESVLIYDQKKKRN
jgi:hypothetical protein